MASMQCRADVLTHHPKPPRASGLKNFPACVIQGRHNHNREAFPALPCPAGSVPGGCTHTQESWWTMTQPSNQQFHPNSPPCSHAGHPVLLPLVQGDRGHTHGQAGKISPCPAEAWRWKTLTAVSTSICIREQALIQHTLTSICRHQDLGERLKLNKNFLALQN